MNELSDSDYIQYKKKLEKYCQDGDLEKFNNIIKYFKYSNLYNNFNDACINGHLEIATKLLNYSSKFNNNKFNDIILLFIKCCNHKKLDIAKFLLSHTFCNNNNKINIYEKLLYNGIIYNDSLSYFISKKYNEKYNEIIYFLLEIDSSKFLINLKKYFNEICMYDNIELFNFFLEKMEKIPDINFIDYFDLETILFFDIKYINILHKKPYINFNNIDKNKILLMLIRNNRNNKYLNNIKYLLFTFPDIDLFVKIDNGIDNKKNSCFDTAIYCSNENNEIIKFFKDYMICNDKFGNDYDDNIFQMMCEYGLLHKYKFLNNSNNTKILSEEEINNYHKKSIENIGFTSNSHIYSYYYERSVFYSKCILKSFKNGFFDTCKLIIQKFNEIKTYKNNFKFNFSIEFIQEGIHPVYIFFQHSCLEKKFVNIEWIIENYSQSELTVMYKKFIRYYFNNKHSLNSEWFFRLSFEIKEKFNIDVNDPEYFRKICIITKNIYDEQTLINTKKQYYDIQLLKLIENIFYKK